MGRMTVDTATLRAQWEAIREQQGPEAFAMIAHVGDGIALLDALDEMRTERDSWQADVESLHGDLAHSMDRIAEEMAAVEAEQERTRVLTKYLSGFDVTEDGEVRDEDGEPYEDTFMVNIGMQVAGIKEIHVALATAKGERRDG